MNKIKGTGPFSKLGYEWTETRSLILRRRLQILVHSNLYYHQDCPILTDKQYDNLAKELVSLQEKYPEIASRVDYHHYFKDYDGSTGMDLPYTLPEIVAIANNLKSWNKVVDKKVQNNYSSSVLKNKKIKKRGKLK